LGTSLEICVPTRKLVMMRKKIYPTIIFTLLIFIYQKEIFYFFEKSHSEEYILFLKKEAGENNITAVSNLVHFYEKKNNKKLLKVYMSKYVELRNCIDPYYKKRCKTPNILIEE